MAKRVRTPTVMQMEAAECGAAALAMILGYYGKYISLEQLRIDCAVSRHGSRANNIIKVAQMYGLEADGYQKSLEELSDASFPLILFWNFNHFVVLDRIKGDNYYINDPAKGRRRINLAEFRQSYTGIVLEFEKGDNFTKSGKPVSTFSLLLKFLPNLQPSFFYIGTAFFISTLLTLLIPSSVKLFIDLVLHDGHVNFIPVILSILLFAVTMKILVVWFHDHLLVKMQEKLTISISTKLLWHTLKLPIQFFNRRYTGDMSSRILLSFKIAKFFTKKFIPLFFQSTMNILLLVMIFVYNVHIGLLTVFSLLLCFIAIYLLKANKIYRHKKITIEDDKLFNKISQGISNIYTIKTHCTETIFFNQCASKIDKIINLQQRLHSKETAMDSIIKLIYPLIATAITTYGAFLLIKSEILLGTIVAIFILFYYIIKPFEEMSDAILNFNRLRTDLLKINDILAFKVDDNWFSSGKKITISHSKLSEISLNKISFSYDELTKPLIKNFTLTINKGQRIALVGRTGSGKSTIAKIIAGIYEPKSGEVLIDNRHRHCYSRDTLALSVGYVDQDIGLFPETVQNNICLWDRVLSNSDIINAAKDACIHNTIINLPSGYESLVHAQVDNFSKGQIQQIEITRALARNPSILILDEATSAIDEKTEKIIDNNIKARNCTCIIVAHRLSTIRDADEILVMDQGKVIERGDHNSLIKQQGFYANLINLER